MRSYELMFLVDPRVSDEEVVGLSDGYKEMIVSTGAQVTKEESWGKRKLAYPINKLGEGKYVVLQVESEEGNPFAEVEQRMKQNDQVLRFLTVRTDAGRLRVRGEQAGEGDSEEGGDEGDARSSKEDS